MSDETIRALISNMPAILTAFALLVGAFATAYVSMSRKVTAMQQDVRKIEVATNSMKDALIESTDKASRAEGELKGAQDERDRTSTVPTVQDVNVVNPPSAPVPTVVTEVRHERL